MALFSIDITTATTEKQKTVRQSRLRYSVERRLGKVREVLAFCPNREQAEAYVRRYNEHHGHSNGLTINATRKGRANEP